MTDFKMVVALKRRIEEEPAVSLERAAQLCCVSARTIRRHIHLFETRRGRNRHILVTLRSIARFLAEEQYQPSRHYDLTRGPKS